MGAAAEQAAAEQRRGETASSGAQTKSETSRTGWLIDRKAAEVQAPIVQPPKKKFVFDIANTANMLLIAKDDGRDLTKDGFMALKRWMQTKGVSRAEVDAQFGKPALLKMAYEKGL